MNDRWYKNAIFYTLDAETYFDSNSDGAGDFRGLISKLDYIRDLGVDCIWMLPFFPTPDRDNGYDVMDYCNVNHRLGTFDEFRELEREMKKRDLRLIMDLVVNHTSEKHPWFMEARKDRNSKYRDYYVWSDAPVDFEKDNLMFTGEEDAVWTFDETAGQFYMHRFYKEQPDLNINNPEVRNEILEIIRFWLHAGIDGFRVDAAEMLIEPYGIPGADKDELVSFLDKMRATVKEVNHKAILIAEVNCNPEEVSTYLMDDNRMHMIFNFFINQNVFLAMARNDGFFLERAMKRMPDADSKHQWLNFLRHHDELTLSLLTEDEKQDVFKAFGPDKNMQIYNRGIRRRLASMLNGDQDLIRLSFSLMFSLPGVPLIGYGDEIGMGEDLLLPGRDSVRTAMQWDETHNAGFSGADAEHLLHPVITSGKYSYTNVNVKRSQADPDSLLNWLKKIVSVRKKFNVIGNGDYGALPTINGIFIHTIVDEIEDLIFFHNMSSESRQVNATGCLGDNFTIVFSSGNENVDGKQITLAPYGFIWLKRG